MVELLIVIGLLGAIALIVIAAINPIEQANRARDTRLKSDGGQLISAIDRYFASVGDMPWATTTDPAPALDWFDAASSAVGVCDDDASATNNAGVAATTCGYDGNLIRNDELKTEFRKRDFLKTATPALNRMKVGKASGASASVYVCFVPLSNAERSKTDNLKSLGAGEPTDGCTTTDWTGSPCYICLP